MIDTFILIILPYIALVIMLVGSILVYRKMSYSITALSTQLIEGKQLYFGSQFMHWGITTLFLGHLIGFLFPAAVIAWNGQPVRLLILETTAYIMGLLFLEGLIILIYRRITHQQLHAVTSKMDIVVYIVLLVQAVSGIWMALTLPWGSSWFASVLSPYLKSLFMLQPDIAAVSAMPLIVKIHVSFAYILIGIIPMSRFMHFLVFPIQYVGRAFQVVIWNRDRSILRNSTHITPKVKAKNN